MKTADKLSLIANKNAQLSQAQRTIEGCERGLHKALYGTFVELDDDMIAGYIEGVLSYQSNIYFNIRLLTANRKKVRVVTVQRESEDITIMSDDDQELYKHLLP